MALEAVGLGLGATQFAAELAVTIVKLKRLWDEVQDVPDHIQSILEELEDVDLILQDVEEQINRDEIPDELKSTVLPRVLRSTQRAYRALEELVESLDRQIVSSRGFRRRLVSVRVVIKKPVLEKMESQLRRALDILNMAINSYTMAYTRISSQVIINRLPLPAPPQSGPARHGQVITTIEPVPPEVDIAKKTTPEEVARLRTIYPGTSWLGRVNFTLNSKDRYEFVLQAPSWLAASIYSVMVERSLHGWNTELKVHNVIRSWKEVEGVVGILETDDCPALLSFLTRQRLPLLTRDRDGFTLLDLSSWSGSVRTFGKLVELGLKSYILDNRWGGVLTSRMDYWIFSLYTAAVYQTGHYAQQQFGHNMIDILSLLSPYDHEKRIKNVRIFADLIIGGRLVNVRRYQQLFLPDLRLSDRVRCFRTVFSRTPISISDFRFILPEMWSSHAGDIELSSPVVVEFSRSEGCSVVHSLATGIGLVLAADRLSPGQFTHGPIFIAMLCESILADPASLHCQEQDFLNCPRPGWDGQGGPQTPFISYLRATLKVCSHADTPRHEFARIPDGILQDWLGPLDRHGGVDLRRYGREERRLQRETVHANGLTNVMLWMRTHRLRLIGITYGSRPQDWVLWWAHEYEVYAGEFWTTVEESTRQYMPGSWPYSSADYDERTGGSEEKWTACGETTPLIWSEVSAQRNLENRRHVYLRTKP